MKRVIHDETALPSLPPPSPPHHSGGRLPASPKPPTVAFACSNLTLLLTHNRHRGWPLLGGVRGMVVRGMLCWQRELEWRDGGGKVVGWTRSQRSVTSLADLACDVTLRRPRGEASSLLPAGRSEGSSAASAAAPEGPGRWRGRAATDSDGCKLHLCRAHSWLGCTVVETWAWSRGGSKGELDGDSPELPMFGG
jgi:hypothetical protein